MQLGTDFLSRIIKTQQKLNHKVFTEGEVNIVYIEGVDLNGKANGDRMNEWNDVRLVYDVTDDKPRLLGAWKATTEPGWKYTLKPLNAQGAFRIAFGQYKAWVVGKHKDHEALVQLWEAGEELDNGLRVGQLRGHRDINKDGLRTDDPVVIQTGIGVNQHWGYDWKTVEGASAGCLVGQSRSGHREFMSIVKSDARYQKNKNYVFWTSILNGSKLEN
ncbi:MAG: hypothetical protein KME29_05050 [Calothrix sp. FI2-JRJ7]|jgi:hypothetical protein|nr:hypothetical protein [Calothrix sp. FI2-JRJ7]